MLLSAEVRLQSSAEGALKIIVRHWNVLLWMSSVSNLSNLPHISQFMLQKFLYGAEVELKNIVAIFYLHPTPISNGFNQWAHSPV